MWWWSLRLGWRCWWCRSARPRGLGAGVGGGAPGYDQGGGVRRWRSLDMGLMMVFVQAGAPRVSFRRRGVVVASVPWARSGVRATRAFEDQCAWRAARAPKSVVAELMRTSSRHVSAVVTRVVADGLAGRDVLAGLARTGIDEIAYRKGHRCLTCAPRSGLGPAGVGGAGPSQRNVAPIFRPTRRGPQRRVDARVGRRGAVDPRHRFSPGHCRRCWGWIRSTWSAGRPAGWTRCAAKPERFTREQQQWRGRVGEGQPVGVVDQPGRPDTAAARVAGLYR